MDPEYILFINKAMFHEPIFKNSQVHPISPSPTKTCYPDAFIGNLLSAHF
jgi:hypothetical protein